jgi:5-methylcytosine-specific restriction endonuclease McrA
MAQHFCRRIEPKCYVFWMGKVCPRCNVQKPHTEEFFRRRGPSEGWYLSSWCKTCCADHAKKKQADRRADPKERVRLLEQKKRHRQSAKGVAAHNRRSLIANVLRKQRRAAGSWMWTIDLWEACKEMWGNRCVYCDAVEELTQDHFVPLFSPECPGTVPWNMVPACEGCNASKRHRDAAVWCKDKQRVVYIAARLELLRHRMASTGSTLAMDDK